MKRVVLVFLSAFVLALSAWAGDPWKDKAFSEWNEQDVQKVLFDSPWVKRVRVSAPWRTPGRLQQDAGVERTPGSASASVPSGAGIPGGAGEGGGGGGAPGGPGGGGFGQRTPQAEFIVRWSSALTVRQAFVRASQLQGSAEAGDSAAFLAQEPPTYQVAVLGRDMSQFEGVDEITLREKSFIRPKKSKQKIAPERVEFVRDNNGSRLMGLVFHFAKTGEDGQGILGPGEREVEFVCESGAAWVSTKFDLRKMADREGQRDL